VKRLVLVRHGRTVWNHAGIVQGQSDSPLDEVGRAQAERMAPVVGALAPVALWASDLSRAADTAAAIGLVTGLTPRHDVRLREVHFGDREGLSHVEYKEQYPEEFQSLRRGRYDDIATAERSIVVMARMTEVLTELLAEIEDGATAIAVSHGAAIKLGVGGLLGMSAPDAVEMLWGMDNCGWAIVTETQSRRALDAYNRIAD
jgi:probable phosphoglycerate mutase